MLVVIALGGNTLLRRGDPIDAEVQRQNVEVAAAAIASLAHSHEVLVTHGNGPQMALLASQSGAGAASRAYMPDGSAAGAEGTIGYLFEQALSSKLPKMQIATLLTQVQVDPEDPAFRSPTRPIGPLLSEAEAKRLRKERGWKFFLENGGYRRLVASPEPRRIVEMATIRLLLQSGALVICAGGGGLPVIATQGGGIQAVEAVIDMDLAAALLALDLRAKVLLLLTDVDAVYTDWTSPGGRMLRKVTPLELRRYAFPDDTMGPKVKAACRFVQTTGGTASIGRLQDAAAILAGTKGTNVRLKWPTHD